MRHTKTVLAALVIAGLGGGYLYAQPGPTGDVPEDTTPPGDGDDGAPLPEVSGSTYADLTPRELSDETKKALTEMEGFHVRVLQLQGAARKAKDVIKLNCVNEHLLAVKQLLNIAESADNDLTEAISSGDRDAQVHQYSQVRLAHERATAERDEAEACIGEELIFIGPTQVTTDGPDIADDPTDDGDDEFAAVDESDFERPTYATPFR